MGEGDLSWQSSRTGATDGEEGKVPPLKRIEWTTADCYLTLEHPRKPGGVQGRTSEIEKRENGLQLSGKP